MKLESSNDSNSLEKKSSSTATNNDEQNEQIATNDNAANESNSKTEVQQSSQATNNNANVTNSCFLDNHSKSTNKTKYNEWEDYHDKLLRVLKKEVCVRLQFLMIKKNQTIFILNF